MTSLRAQTSGRSSFFFILSICCKNIHQFTRYQCHKPTHESSRQVPQSVCSILFTHFFEPHSRKVSLADTKPPKTNETRNPNIFKVISKRCFIKPITTSTITTTRIAFPSPAHYSCAQYLLGKQRHVRLQLPIFTMT